MKKTLIGLAVLTAVAAMGEDWPGTGIFTWSSIADFGDGSTPFTMGQGILEYTGESGEVTVPLAFNPSNNRPTTLRVTNPATTLTVSGQVSQSAGAFIKDGPGTLRIANAGVNNLGVKREAEDKDSYDIAWDENGAVTSFGYAVFTINEGRVVFEGGASNRVNNISWIGSRTQKDTFLDIKGGIFTGSGNWFCISRGAGKTDNNVRAAVTVTDGAVVNLGGGLCMNNGNGVDGYYGRTFLTVDDSAVTVGGAFFMGEGTGEPTLVLTNGATLVCNDGGSSGNSGFEIGRTGSAKATATVVDGSTLQTYSLYVNKGSSLTVKDSTLKFDRALQSASRSTTTDTGSVTFDNATLTPLTANSMHDWFNSMADAPIDVLGTLSVTTPGFSGIGRTLRSRGAGAAVAKDGTGYLTLRATELPVAVNAGTLRMSVPTLAKTNGLTGAISLASGAALEVAGEDALGAMTVNADAAKFEPLGMEAQRGGWTTVDYGRMRPDGVIQLMDNLGGKSGTATLNQKIPVDRSFRLSFDTFEYTTTGRPADHFNVHFHEKNPSDLISGSNNGAGANSFTVNVDYWNYCVRFMVGGVEKKKISTNTGVYQTLHALNFAEKRRHTIVYDAVAKKVVFTITFPNGVSQQWDYDVDLEVVCGQKTAYLGFGANTGGSYNTFSVTNLRFEEPGTPGVGFVGGRKTLAANETFTAKIAPTETQDAFLMGRLDYADGAAVCVTNVAFPDGQPLKSIPPSIEDQAQWTLTGGAYWRDDGTLATSRAIDNNTYQSGSATTLQTVPIDGDWTASFDWQLGAHSTPADAFAFSLICGSSSILDVNWRYYLDYNEGEVKKNTRLTRVWVGKANNVDLSAQICTNAAPIDLANKGPAHIVLDYRRGAAELDVTMTQQYNGETLTKSLTFTNVVLGVNGRAKIRFNGQVGGLYTENVISGLTFESAAGESLAAKGDRIGGFGFERLNGSGTLVKTGPGDLALVSTDNAHAALRVDAGGLNLRKQAQEPVTARHGGWQFNDASGTTCAPDGIQIGEIVDSHVSNAQTKRRVCVAGDWRCSFSMWVNSGNPADALSFFLHNDSRGNTPIGGGTGGAGYTGIGNSVAIAWYFYPGNAGLYKKIGVSKNGAGISYSQSHDPLTLVGNTTDVVLTYDAATKTLTSVMTQNEELKDGETYVMKTTSMTNTFTDVDVAGCVKSDFAYLGFGVGCGGCQATPRFTNFRFERLTKADREQTAPYLASVDVRNDATVRMDTSLTNAVFTLAPTVTLAAGRTLTAKALNENATLAMGTLTLGAGSALAGDGSAVIAPSVLAGDLGTLKLDGATLAVPEGVVTNRLLGKSEVLLTHGAKFAVRGGRVLSLSKLYVDGERVPGSVYRAGEVEWVAEGALSLGGGTILILR